MVLESKRARPCLFSEFCIEPAPRNENLSEIIGKEWSSTSHAVTPLFVETSWMSNILSSVLSFAQADTLKLRRVTKNKASILIVRPLCFYLLGFEALAFQDIDTLLQVDVTMGFENLDK